MIKLKIDKQIDNPNYEQENKDYNENRKMGIYGQRYDVKYPEKFITNSVLEVEITDEQFEAIRKAVLEKF